MINRPAFYASIRASLFNTLKQSQVYGIDAVLNEWEAQGLTDLRWLAYMLATTYHETARTMQAIEEYGKGKGRAYGRKIKMDRTTYDKPDQLYYGRGLVQLTWYENYKHFGDLLNIDLLNKPSLALDLKTAIDIMFLGMKTGLFTGIGLPKYFNDTTEDYIGARKIINGKDKAELIAGYAHKFLAGLLL